MNKDEMKQQLQFAVGEWVDRVCADSNVLKRFGRAEMRFHVSYEGEEDDGQLHFEGAIDEVRRIEVSDETNPLQGLLSGR